MRPHAVRIEVLSVIGTDDDDGVVQQATLFDQPYQLSYPVVQVSDRGLILELEDTAVLLRDELRSNKIETTVHRLNEVAIDALAKVLGQRKHLFLFGRRWDEQVRATAAMTLRQISHRRAGEVLSRFRKDGDTRVRQLAVS